MGPAEWEKKNIAMCNVSLGYIKNALCLRSHFVDKNSKDSKAFGETELLDSDDVGTWKLEIQPCRATPP